MKKTSAFTAELTPKKSIKRSKRYARAATNDAKKTYFIEDASFDANFDAYSAYSIYHPFNHKSDPRLGDIYEISEEIEATKKKISEEIEEAKIAEEIEAAKIAEDISTKDILAEDILAKDILAEDISAKDKLKNLLTLRHKKVSEIINDLGYHTPELYDELIIILELFE
jgi:hypothetical protein